ncbi:MAG: restriction endonuclease [Kiritimatiellia bacterium]
MATETWLNEGKERLTAEKLTEMVGDKDIKVVGFYDHKKATERYAVLSIAENDVAKVWCLPYYYRRTNVRIDTITELVSYIKQCKSCLSASGVSRSKTEFSRLEKTLLKNAGVTRPIFKRLLKKCGEWVWNKDFKNSNPQRRIQAIKERGFTIATKMEAKKTYHALLPLAVVKAPTYETIPAKVRKAIFVTLGGVDAYSGRKAALSALPDHKFPEIRWDEATAESNDNLDEEEMRKKFQLVPEAINQSKREVCRECFRTGRRGKFAEIDFYYSGDEAWPSGVPTTGKVAEAGCVGCFWYDMAAWRKALNEFIKARK